MPDPVVEFQPASALSPAELTALWNRAYEAYFVPLAFTEAQLAHHLRRSGVDLDRSLVGRIDGEAVGLSCAAIRGPRAWIGGFGVAAPHRRQGLAARMMAEHLSRLDRAGIVETSLEVIAQNPAREIYRRCGFAARGAVLQVIGGAPAPGGAAETIALDLESLARVHAAIAHTAPMTWRRETPTLLDDLRHGAAAHAVMRAGRPVAFAVIQEMGGQDGLLDAAAVDVAAAEALLAALARLRPGRRLRIVDEPETSPLAQAMRAAGFEVSLTQVEMVRPRG